MISGTGLVLLGVAFVPYALGMDLFFSVCFALPFVALSVVFCFAFGGVEWSDLF